MWSFRVFKTDEVTLDYVSEGVVRGVEYGGFYCRRLLKYSNR